MHKAHADYGLRFLRSSTSDEGGDDAVQNERITMGTQVSITTATQADVDRYIARAHQLRSEYIAQSIKSGLARLRGRFSHKGQISNASA